MLPFSKFVIVSAVVFIAYIAGLYRFLTHFDENKCGMTYMYGYPTFVVSTFCSDICMIFQDVP